MIVLACITPHPPIILPTVGSKKDRGRVKKTIGALEFLGKKFREKNPDLIIISAPHADWGFNVPLFFLAKDFKGEIETFLTGFESPKEYFNKGREVYFSKIKEQNSKVALIASGDLSHRLKQEGPYGFHPQGPEFDNALIEGLRKKEMTKILKLDKLYPEAGECGLRSFCFMLGILDGSGINYAPEILSYERPFGVGYLAADFKLAR